MRHSRDHLPKPDLSPAARQAYRHIRTVGWITQETPLEGLPELIDQGLCRYDDHTDGYIPVDVRTVARIETARSYSSIRDALYRIAELADLADDLDIPAELAEGNGIRRLPTQQAAAAAVGAAVSDAKSYVWTCHPTDRPSALPLLAHQRDLSIVQRGVRLRVIYLDNARTRPPEQEYAALLAPHGAQFRTDLPPFERIIVVDGAVAFITDHAGPHEGSPALKITHPSLVRFLGAVYEQQWLRADPWIGETVTADTPPGITTKRQRRILKGLDEGVPIKAIAAELEVGTTTIYADIDRLHEATGTSNLFGLGAWYHSEAGRNEMQLGC